MRHGKDLWKNYYGEGVSGYSKGGTVGWVVLRVVFHSCQGRLQIAGGGRAGVDDGQDRSQLGGARAGVAGVVNGYNHNQWEWKELVLSVIRAVGSRETCSRITAVVQYGWRRVGWRGEQSRVVNQYVYARPTTMECGPWFCG